jgi:predicted Kef-type K+ transport protein
MTRLLRTNEMVGAGGPRLIPILFIALLVATGAVAVVYGVATAAGPGSFFTGKLLQTTNNNDTAGSPTTQFCENQTSTTGQP